MAHGFRLVPVEAEVAAGDRQIRRHSQLFAPALSQQGAIVADAQAKASGAVAAQGAGSPAANLADQG
jgi:hypothetical protein